MPKLRGLDEWVKFKQKILRGIWEDRLIGYLDPGAEEFLVLLNKPTLLATTSSCTGRITIIEGKWHWLRDEARIVFKSHSPIESRDIVSVVKLLGSSDLWIKVTGPILHFRTPRLLCAMRLLSHARSSGFKHSGIISINRRLGHVVEVMSGVQLMIPLASRGSSLISIDELEKLIVTINEALVEGRRRLEELSLRISSEPGPCEL
ncbi:MAG: hypothetical protein QXO93_04600 [Acidilobaceae archaeon]